jgi:hypothetical protein
MKTSRKILVLLSMVLLAGTLWAAFYPYTVDSLHPRAGGNNLLVDNANTLLSKIAESVARLVEGGVTISNATINTSTNVQATIPLTQARTYSTNIVLASASTPVVLGSTQTFQWLTIVGNTLGHTANTNTIYLQTQADDGTNGIPIAPGGTVTLSMPANRFDYLSNYWVGGIVGGAKVFWGY